MKKIIFLAASCVVAMQSMANCPTPSEVKTAFFAAVKPEEIGELVKAALNNPKIPKDFDGEGSVYAGWLFMDAKNKNWTLKQQDEKTHYACTYLVNNKEIVSLGINK